MVADSDLYFEARLAFVDRPDARIWLRDERHGAIAVMVEEPMPANPLEPDHRKHRPWVWVDLPSGREIVERPQRVRARALVGAHSRAGGGRGTAAAIAARLRHAWGLALRSLE